MRIVFIRGVDLDVKRTCQFVREAMRERSRMIDKKSLCKQIRELAETGLIKIAAYEGQQLAGIVLLHTADEEWQINPGILGGHPLVKTGANAARISGELLNAAVECATERCAQKLRLTAIRRPEECGDRADHAFYKKAGFEHELSYVEMICSVKNHPPSPVPLPEGYSFSAINHTDKEDLYPVYQAAFQQGEARFYFLQDHDGQRAFYDTLGWEEASSLYASHVIVLNSEPVAFSLVLPFSIRSYHISCMCVHPDHQRRRLGEAMLVRILRSAESDEIPLVSLGTEPEMRACCLYTKYGFEIRGGTSYYVRGIQSISSPAEEVPQDVSQAG